ncbi:MAG TPA: hypothetical protein VL860_11615 [Planctomycetota bacterium]|nr:hypothetical protein [Planctomycetota bacterium]
MDTTKLIDRARSSARKRDFDGAVDMYMQALEFNPNDVASRLELHKLYVREAQEGKKSGGSVTSMWTKFKGMVSSPKTKEQADKVIVELEKSLRKKPTDYAIMVDMAKAAGVALYYDMVIGMMEEVRSAKAGGDMKLRCAALRELAFAYKGAEKYDEAIAAFTEWAKFDPTNREAMMEGRDIAARRQAKMMSDKGDGDVRDQRGGAARAQQTDEQKRTDEVRAIFEAGIKTEADASLIWAHWQEQMKGEVKDVAIYEKATEPLLFLRKYEEAKGLIKKAQAMQPSDPRWGFKLDDISVRKMTDELRDLQTKARAGDATAKDALHKLNTELIAFKFDSFTRREKQYPTESTYKQELGNIALLKKDYDEALRCFQYTRNDPKFQMESLTCLGKAFRAKKKFDLAISALTEGIDRLQMMNDRKKAMLYERALTFELKGDKEKYKKDLTTLYESDVRYRDVQPRLDKLEE